MRAEIERLKHDNKILLDQLRRIRSEQTLRKESGQSQLSIIPSTQSFLGQNTTTLERSRLCFRVPTAKSSTSNESHPLYSRVPEVSTIPNSGYSFPNRDRILIHLDRNIRMTALVDLEFTRKVWRVEFLIQKPSSMRPIPKRPTPKNAEENISRQIRIEEPFVGSGMCVGIIDAAHADLFLRQRLMGEETVADSYIEESSSTRDISQSQPIDFGLRCFENFVRLWLFVFYSYFTSPL